MPMYDINSLMKEERAIKKNLARIMKFIKKTKDGHWLWTGSRCGLRREYGQVRLNGKKPTAHRAVWTLLKGPIFDGLDLLHQCGQTLCVNPDHVRPGTKKENTQDSIVDGTYYAAGKFGDKHPRTVIPDSEIPKIIAACKVRGQQKVQADKYGVSQAHISMIVNGKQRSKR